MSRCLGLLLLLALAGHAAALSNACDDAMGGDEGFSLKKIHDLPAAGPKRAQAWVKPLVNRAIHNTKDLNAIFTFPKGTPKKHGCKIKSYTWGKLCVPKNGSHGEFRVKVFIQSNCGSMHVKYRVSRSGEALLWGRTAS